MKLLPDKTYLRILVLSAYIIIGIVALYLLFEYGIGLVLPFIIAFLLSLLVYPAAKFLKAKLHFPRKLTIVILVLILVGIVVATLFFIGRALVGELSSLVKNYESTLDVVRDALDSLDKKFEEWFPNLPQTTGIEKLSDELLGTVETLVSNFLSKLFNSLPSIVIESADVVTEIVLFITVLVLATYYFSADHDKLKASLQEIIPDSFRKGVKSTYDRFIKCIVVYLRAALIMLVITFGELLVSFYILRVDYPWLVAVIVAIIDMFPVVGVGTVAFPWAIIELITGNYWRAFGILIMYVVITFVRQLIEPRIVGKKVGLSPLFTLFAMYVGYKLMGFLGIILGPFFGIIASAIFDEWRAGKKADAVPEAANEAPVDEPKKKIRISGKKKGK